MQTLLKNTRAYTLLKKEGEREAFSHAYLLLFDDARNLRTALKTFAKLFFDCAEPKTAAQNRVFELIDAESFSDCVHFPAEGKKLVVEDAEKILEESTLAPVEGERKLFILSDFAEANVQTQNKLLKLLEEPPKGVVFLLGATSSFSVLPTVLSRTKKLKISDFTQEEVVSCLQRIYGDKYPREAFILCAATANGNVGDACNILEGGYYKTLMEDAFSLLLAPAHKLPALFKQVGETPHKKELLGVMRNIFRDALVCKQGFGKSRLLMPTEYERTAEIAEKFSATKLLYAQIELSKAEKQVKFNAVFSQCIEVCISNILEK